jgi:hypothetical protein
MMTAVLIVGIVVVGAVMSWVVLRVTGAPSEDLSGPTGAPAGSDLDRSLRIQRLKLEDIEANRAGSLSAREAARITAESRKFRVNLWFGLIAFVGAATVTSLSIYSKNPGPGMFWVPGIALIAIIPIYFLALAMFGKPDPDVTAGKVTAVKGAVEHLSVWPTRDGFTASIGGTQYKGLNALELGESLRDGQTVKAYVLPNAKILVAVDPI